MNRHISRTWWAVSLAAALAVAACGGGDSAGDASGDQGSRDPTTTEATSTSDAATSLPSDDSAPSGAPGAVATQLGIDRVFTGEGSEAFCAEVRALQQAVSGGDGARGDEATVTGQMAALTPPAEIAADWNLMVSVQQSASSETEDPLTGVDQGRLDAYGQASAVIAAYLGDVCRLPLVG